tara:strand:- start:379 stop:732 length:354 start_codon:yes stop_codon:yes gene_type:complete
MIIESKFIPNLNTDIEFFIGQNAKDNFEVIDSAEPNDIWFHVKDHSSSHVIAHLPEEQEFNKKQLRYIIKQGAILCKQHSKFKSSKNINIIYTNVENITKTNIPGQVHTINTKELSI